MDKNQLPKILLTFRIGGENGGPFISHKRIMESSLNEKYELKPLMVPVPRVLRTRKGMRDLVRTIKNENPDLVQITGLQLEGYFVMRACKKAKVKTLLAVHGSSTEACNIGFIKKKILEFLEYRTIRAADGVFGVSDYVSGWDICKRAKKYFGTVYNIPFSPASFHEQENQNLRKEFNIQEDDIVVVSTGRITEDKGFDIFWETVQKIGKRPKVKYLIAGDGAYRAKWKQEIEASELKDDILLLGYRSDIHAILNISDIFMICTKHETLCISLLEAASHGLPLIATNVGGIPEIVDENCGYLVEKNNVEGFSKALTEMLDDAEKRKKMGQNAQHKVMKKFDMNLTLNQLNDIYGEYTESKRR